MSEFILSPVEFTTIHGVVHQVCINPLWGVEIDGEFHRHYQPAAAVVILGFMKSMDSVVARADFYQTVLAEYDQQVETYGAPQVTAISRARNGTNIGGRLNSLVSPMSSQFRTNLFQLSLGFHKRMLVSSNPANVEHVERTFDNAKLSDDPDVDERFRGLLFSAYMQRRDFLLDNTSRSDDAKNKQKTAPIPRAPTGSSITEISTRATRNPVISGSDVTYEDKKPRSVTKTIPKQLEADTAKGIEQKTFILTKDVPRVVAEHIFDMPETTSLSIDELCDLFSISPADKMRVQNTLLALKHASFVTQHVENYNVVFVRTPKQRTTK